MSAENPSFDGHSFPLESPTPSVNAETDPIKPITRKQKIGFTAGALVLSGAIFGFGRVVETNADDNIAELQAQHSLILDDFTEREKELRAIPVTSPTTEIPIAESLSALRNQNQKDTDLFTQEIGRLETQKAFGDKLENAGLALVAGTTVTLAVVELYSFRKPSSQSGSPQQDQTS